VYSGTEGRRGSMVTCRWIVDWEGRRKGEREGVSEEEEIWECVVCGLFDYDGLPVLVVWQFRS
jgi:hypothetical protein